MGDDPLREFKNRYVYVTEGDSVHDLEGFGHDRPMLIKEFRNFTANIIMEIETPAPTQAEPNRTKTKFYRSRSKLHISLCSQKYEIIQ